MEAALLAKCTAYLSVMVTFGSLQQAIAQVNNKAVVDKPAIKESDAKAPPKKFEFLAGSPESIVYNMLVRALDKGVSVAEKNGDQKAYFSADLNKFISKIDNEQWRDFDADIITGVQDYSDLKVSEVKTIILRDVVVSVTFNDGSNNRRVEYKMKQETEGEWRIDDIVYFDDKTESFRDLMLRLKASDNQNPDQAPKVDKPSRTPAEAVSASIRRLSVFTGKCRFQLIEGFFPCNSKVPYVEMTNGRAFLTFEAGSSSFTVSGGSDRQPNLETFYQGLDTIKIAEKGKNLGEDNDMSGECRFDLNKSGSKFYSIKCDIFNRRKGTVYNFYLEKISSFTKKNF